VVRCEDVIDGLLFLFLSWLPMEGNRGKRDF
jgi:hypothetical protein